jgi:hypothetical protein
MPLQKIKTFGTLTPTGADSSAANTLRAMAGLTAQVGDIAFQEGAKIQQKKGALEGAQSAERDEEGKLKPLEKKSDFTIHGESFNKAAVLAHRAQIGIDTKQRLEELQREHELNPKGFASAAKGFRDGTLQGMNPELAAIVSRDIDASIANKSSALQEFAFKREKAQHRSTSLDSIESQTNDILNAIRTGDEATATQAAILQDIELDEWVSTNTISADEARKVREDREDRSIEQAALGDIEKIVFNEELSLEEQFKKGSEFVESLRTKDIKDLSPEQKDSLVRVVGAQVNDVGRQIAATQSGRDLEAEKIVSNLKVQANLIVDRAKDGESVPIADLMEQTELLHNKGMITGNERTSIVTKIAKAEEEMSRISLADKRIVARLSGDNSITMKPNDIDSFYKRKIADDIEQLPPEMQNVAKAEFVLKTRSIPQQIKADLSSQVLSNEPDQMKQALDLVDRIDNVPGLANLAVSASQRAFMENVVNLSQSMVPEQAIALARDLTAPANKARVEARELEIRTEKMPSKYADNVEGAFESFWLGTDQLMAGLNKEIVEKEYKELFESFFKAGMSKEGAEKKTVDILQTNWKESDFGFMKHRPEDYYQVGGNTDYMRDQLFKDLKEDFIGSEFSKESLMLMSDEETARTASQGAPTYKVLGLDGNGEFVGFPGRWSPDAKAEVERQQGENLKMIEEAKGQKKEKAEADKLLEGFKL